MEKREIGELIKQAKSQWRKCQRTNLYFQADQLKHKIKLLKRKLHE